MELLRIRNGERKARKDISNWDIIKAYKEIVDNPEQQEAVLGRLRHVPGSPSVVAAVIKEQFGAAIKAQADYLDLKEIQPDSPLTLETHNLVLDLSKLAAHVGLDNKKVYNNLRDDFSDSGDQLPKDPYFDLAVAELTEDEHLDGASYKYNLVQALKQGMYSEPRDAVAAFLQDAFNEEMDDPLEEIIEKRRSLLLGRPALTAYATVAAMSIGTMAPAAANEEGSNRSSGYERPYDETQISQPVDFNSFEDMEVDFSDKIVAAPPEPDEEPEQSQSGVPKALSPANIQPSFAAELPEDTPDFNESVVEVAPLLPENDTSESDVELGTAGIDNAAGSFQATPSVREPAPAPEPRRNEANQRQERGVESQIAYGYSIDKFKDFDQCLGPWGNRMVTLPDGSQKRFCDLGCGPTSVAAVANVLTGREIDPNKTLEQTVAMSGFDHFGTSTATMVSLAKQNGLAGSYAVDYQMSYDQINAEIRSGAMVMLAGRGTTPYVPAGSGDLAHFLTVRAVTEKGDYLLYDPFPKVEGTWNPDTRDLTKNTAYKADHLINNSFVAVVLKK